MIVGLTLFQDFTTLQSISQRRMQEAACEPHLYIPVVLLGSVPV
jgi:hypothetical protein